LYVQSHLNWQHAELAAADRYLGRLRGTFAGLQPLIVLDLPLADLYEGHWSLTGVNPPDAHSSDEAVYLPGRNALLLVKAAIWCQLHGIEQLALGTLGTNPFDDATPGFFDAFEAMLNSGGGPRLQVARPLGSLTKCQVMELGRDLPLESTFSCIAPVSGLHCGQCNKCAERQAAFRQVGWPDPTIYAFGQTAPRAEQPTAIGRDEQE
jgi:7-cyano-7-deazaguanine synthase